MSCLSIRHVLKLCFLSSAGLASAAAASVSAADRHTAAASATKPSSAGSTSGSSPAGSEAWWIGASDSRYSTALGILDSFADPSFTQVDGKYYAYATNNQAGINVQVAVSSDFKTWTKLNSDALPKTGPWTYKVPRVWAPDVRKNNNGKFVLHYSAKPYWRTDRHCVGVAVADTPAGPFIPQTDPLACPLDQGGAIDSSGFRDPRTGNLYAVYKIDGNAQGHGGMCNNMKTPQSPTPIMLQRLQGDGMTKIGEPVKILDRTTQDGPLVEAPSLLYDAASGRYVLFYSSGCYADPVYDTAYVFSAGSDITGPYNRVNPAAAPAQAGGKPSQRLYKGGIDGLHAPGGATAVRCSDGIARMVLHGYTNGQGRRSMYTARLQINGDAQRVTAWSDSYAIQLGYANNTMVDPDPLNATAGSSTLDTSEVNIISVSLASNPTARAHVFAAAATAVEWDTTQPTVMPAKFLPAGSDASSLRADAPSLDDFLGTTSSSADDNGLSNRGTEIEARQELGRQGERALEAAQEADKERASRRVRAVPWSA